MVWEGGISVFFLLVRCYNLASLCLGDGYTALHLMAFTLPFVVFYFYLS